MSCEARVRLDRRASLVLLVLALGGWVLVRPVTAVQGYGATEQFVEIPQGAGPASIGQRLIEAGVVRDRVALSRWSWPAAARGAVSRPANTVSIGR